MAIGPQEWPLLPQRPGGVPSVPSVPGMPQAPGYSADDPPRIAANFSGESRTGRWVVPPFVVAAPTMANIKLDLRDAVPQSDVIRLSVEGIAGGLTLVLPQGWAVDTDRLTKGLGSVRNKINRVPIAGYPVVLITGSMGLGTFVARGERFYERWGRARRQARQQELMR